MEKTLTQSLKSSRSGGNRCFSVVTGRAAGIDADGSWEINIWSEWNNKTGMQLLKLFSVNKISFQRQK